MNWFNKLISIMLPFVPKPIVGFFSKHYIAGDKLSDAITLVKDLNKQQMIATIDLLGEEVKEKEHSIKAVEQYQEVLHAIHQNKLDANISLKPTHMGLKIDQGFCYENIRTLVVAAHKLNNFVRIDMEDSTCIDDTIEMYLQLRKKFDNVGTVLQSYMRRFINDINMLIPLKANLRICKGIYNEKREIAYKDKSIINYNFNYGMERLLRNGCYIGIATHDEKLVWNALRLIDLLQLKPDQYEFQMLLGVDHELRRIIVNSGHRLRVYVPFGTDWFGYSIRRLKENPAIAGYIIGNIFDRILGRKQ
jgi:proline dehydrogenase